TGANQATADAVASSLRSSPTLMGNRIEIEARGGQVTLSGVLASPAQKAEAINLARMTPGVSVVADRLTVAGEARVSPVHCQIPHGGLFGRRGGGGGDVIYDGGAAGAAAGGAPVADSGPLPEGPAGMPGATQAAAPGYPNYAWPSYAPYPNFS